MRIQNVVLSVSAALLLVALLVLLAKVRQDSPAADVPEDALADALRRHQSRGAGPGAPPPGPTELRTLSRQPVAAPDVKAEVPRPADEDSPPPHRPVIEDLGFRKESGDDSPLEPKTDSAAARPPVGFSAMAEHGGPNEELQARMAEVNQLYDRREYDAALERARAVLGEAPGNVRMLRVVVSSACMTGDSESAGRFFGELPPRDQRQMRIRCERYGVELPAAER